MERSCYVGKKKSECILNIKITELLWHFDCMITANFKSKCMKLLKNTIAIIITAGFISSCIPHPGRRPMPPGHDKKVEKLKEHHPSNRNK